MPVTLLARSGLAVGNGGVLRWRLPALGPSDPEGGCHCDSPAANGHNYGTCHREKEGAGAVASASSRGLGVQFLWTNYRLVIGKPSSARSTCMSLRRRPLAVAWRPCSIQPPVWVIAVRKACSCALSVPQ